MAIQQWFDAISSADISRLVELTAPQQFRVVHDYGLALSAHFDGAKLGYRGGQPHTVKLTSSRADNRATVTALDSGEKFSVIKTDGDWYVIPARSFVDQLLHSTSSASPGALTALLLAASFR